MIIDILGREVKVGDIVVSTNNSSSYSQIHVVTRLGSTDRIQVNGCSYLMAEYVMICTEQYALAKGEEETKKLIAKIAKYAEFFEEKPVEKKLPSPKFMIYRCSEYRAYNAPKGPQRYFVVRIQGTMQESYGQIKEFFDHFDLSAFGAYFNKESLNKRNAFSHADVGTAKTMKELKVLGLDGAINREVLETDREWNILQSYN